MIPVRMAARSHKCSGSSFYQFCKESPLTKGSLILMNSKKMPMLTAMVLVIFSESIFLIRNGKPTVSAVMTSMTLRCSPLNIVKGEAWFGVIEFSNINLCSREKSTLATVAVSSEDHGTQPDCSAFSVLWKVIYNRKFFFERIK